MGAPLKVLQGVAKGVGERLPLVLGDTEGDAPAESGAVGVGVLDGVGAGISELVSASGGLVLGVALADTVLILVAEGNAPNDRGAVRDVAGVEEGVDEGEAVGGSV